MPTVAPFSEISHEIKEVPSIVGKLGGDITGIIHCSVDEYFYPVAQSVGRARVEMSR